MCISKTQYFHCIILLIVLHPKIKTFYYTMSFFGFEL
nr:MAG TPA: hypothetical protein [Caudoviricetes sp.]